MASYVIQFGLALKYSPFFWQFFVVPKPVGQGAKISYTKVSLCARWNIG